MTSLHHSAHPIGVAPDELQNLRHSVALEKFVNLLLIDGKKVKAWKLLMITLSHIQKKSKNGELSAPDILMSAFDHCSPSVEVRKVRVAGTTYLVPAVLPKKKQHALAMRWILEGAKKKKKTSSLSFSHCLADEVVDAFLKQGYARSKRNELHRLAEANRASLRYRWW